MQACLAPFRQCFPSKSTAAEQQQPTPPTSQSTQAPTSTTTEAKPKPPTNMSARTTKIAVIVYSLHGHVAKLSESIIEGVKSTPNVEYKAFQIAETLPNEVLGKMHANKAPIENLPVIKPDDLKEFDGFVFGFPTRYGRAVAQVSQFFDQTGGLWASGALVGKFATIFTSTASQHGGLETTQLTTVPFLVHHGIIYVPHGYQNMGEQGAVDGIIGSGPYGAGAVTGGQGQLQPAAQDLAVAKAQGAHFAKVVSTYVKGLSA